MNHGSNTAYDYFQAEYCEHWRKLELSGKVTAFDRKLTAFDELLIDESVDESFDAKMEIVDILDIIKYSDEENTSGTFYVPIDVNFLEELNNITRIEEAIAIARLAGLENISDRLLQLISFDDELEPGEEPISLLSIKKFLRFLLEHENIYECSIVITYNGNVKAKWEYSEDQIFSIEFYPSDDVRYLAFVPNTKRSDGVERTAGWSTVYDVFDRAEALGVMEWVMY